MSIDVLFSVVEVEVDSAWSPAPRRTPFRSLDAVYGETPVRSPFDAISPVRSGYDGLSSKIAELDDNNNMTTSGQYDVYGAPRAGTQQGVAGTSSQGYVGSLGHVTDASTGGLIYIQARYYDPGVGRFVSEDPGKDGESWYLYTSDNPVNKIDPNGKWDQSLIDAGLLLIRGGVSQLWVASKDLIACATNSLKSAMTDDSNPEGAALKAEYIADAALFGNLGGSGLLGGLEQISMGMTLVYLGMFGPGGGDDGDSGDDGASPPVPVGAM